MQRNCHSTAVPILSALIIGALVGGASSQEQKQFDPASKAQEIAPIANEAKSTLVLDPKRTIVISGDFKWDHYLMAGHKIIFKKGAKLIFSKKAKALRDEFYLAASVIEVADPTTPPIITWQKSNLAAPGNRGQAASGPHGAAAGAHGANGAHGAIGNPGASGEKGPSLTIFVKSIANSGFVVDFSGGDGGPGGKGQKGGNGGNGAQGPGARNSYRSAFGIKTAVGCEAGPGRGGNGGTAGNGGTGGIGGNGGRGGDVSIVSLAPSLPTLTQFIRTNLSSGNPGNGGAGGDPGAAGSGGPEGSRTSWCRGAGRQGGNGAGGAVGSPGGTGSQNQAGDFYVGTLTEGQFKALFNF